MIGFNKDLEKTQLLSGLLTPAAETFGRESLSMQRGHVGSRGSIEIDTSAEDGLRRIF